ncbi:MAG: transcription termination factor NusA [Candidatus Kapaibacterium sp.]
MAKRKTKSKINKSHIVEAFAEMARQKSIDRDLLQGIMEDTFAQMVRKKYGPDAEFDIIVNMDKGDIEIYLIREVVEEPEDPSLQIALSEANEDEEDYELGDEHLTELNLENLAENFGRRMISMAGQTLSQRVREVEKENIINEYSEKVGEIIVGEVYQVRRNDVYVQHNRVELRMPRSEQIWRERYKKGETIRALMKEVRSEEGTSSQPEIIISRSDPMFLHKLMEIEIPEIYDGIIEIKSIAREPGERAKVAVLSNDERVDPVGACVGMKGVRIHSIVRELSNESIDVIPYDPDPKTFISRALSPAKIKEIAIDDDTRTATVLVADDQVSLAIGRGGQNVRLAMKLTGFTIDLVKEGGEDIELIEFKDELGESLYESLIMLDIETAKEFLRFDEQKLLEIEGMTAKKLREIRGIMIVEFDENELRDILPHLSLDAVLSDEENASEEGTTPEQDGEEIATTPAADSSVAESGSESAPEGEPSTPTEESTQASETAGDVVEEETSPTTAETAPVAESEGESTPETEVPTATDESTQASEAAGDVAEENASPEDSVETENAKTSEENVSGA